MPITPVAMDPQGLLPHTVAHLWQICRLCQCALVPRCVQHRRHGGGVYLASFTFSLVFFLDLTPSPISSKAPSTYALVRHTALKYVVDEVLKDCDPATAPRFLFGDMNFRLNLAGVVDVRFLEKSRDEWQRFRLTFSLFIVHYHPQFLAKAKGATGKTVKVCGHCGFFIPSHSTHR